MNFVQPVHNCVAIIVDRGPWADQWVEVRPQPKYGKSHCKGPQ